MSPSVLIYRDLLLPYSETFIATQVASLSRYQGWFVGTEWASCGGNLPSANHCRVMADYVSHPAFWKMAFKLGGLIPQDWLQAICTLSPNLIHAHLGMDGLWALHLARRLNLPLVVTFHGSDATAMEHGQTGYPNPMDLIHHRGRFFRDVYLMRRSQLFHHATCIIAVSDFIRQRLIAQGCPQNKVQVQYIGVDTQRFSPDWAIAREPIVLFVGRLIEKKGCADLMRAMVKLQVLVPQAELVIVGDGPLRARLEQLAMQHSICCRFLGAQPHEVVRHWMNRATVLGVPSVTASNGDSEGLPTVVTEAMAMALPIVGTRHAGIPEAVLPGETGLLVDEGDWEALAHQLVRVFQDESLRQRLAQAAYRRANAQFDLKRCTAQLETVYDRIICR